jgi:hypothetical protein
MKIVEKAFPTDQIMRKELQSLIEDELLNDDVAKEMAKKTSNDLFKELNIQGIQDI